MSVSRFIYIDRFLKYLYRVNRNWFNSTRSLSEKDEIELFNIAIRIQKDLESINKILIKYDTKKDSVIH